jgi:hypothetical protein
VKYFLILHYFRNFVKSQLTFASMENQSNSTSSDSNAVFPLVSVQVGAVPWPPMDPDHILTQLRELNEQFCPNKKKFYKTYCKWATLGKEQKDKTMQFYNALEPAYQSQVIIYNK